MKECISSTSNPRVKELVKLRESSRYRRKRKLFVIEGFEDFECILKYRKVILEMFYCPSLIEKSGNIKKLEYLKDFKINLIELSEEAFLKASYRKNSDGFLSLANQWSLELEDIDLVKDEICVVLDGIEKPGNLGAIIRSMEAMGIKSLILSDAYVDLFNPNVVRSSRGLLSGVQVGRGTKEEVHSLLQKYGFSIFGVCGSGKNILWDHAFSPKTALIFGSEKNGLDNFWKKNINTFLKIPMYGRADSLNLHASVACTLFEFNRQTR